MLSAGFWTEVYRIGEAIFTPLSSLTGAALLSLLVFIQALVRQLLTAALTDPAASVRFIEFGDSFLNFELGAWSGALMHKPRAFMSEVNFAIWRHLRDAGIEVPYPQRDLYVKEVPQ